MCVLKDSINHSGHPIPNWFLSLGHKSEKGPWWLQIFVPVSTANSSFYTKASAASGKQIKSSSKLPLDMDKNCLGGLAGLIPAGTRPPAAEPLVQCFNIWSYCPWVKNDAWCNFDNDIRVSFGKSSFQCMCGFWIHQSPALRKEARPWRQQLQGESQNAETDSLKNRKEQV